MAYPRVHWSIGGAAYDFNRGQSAITWTLSANDLKIIDGTTTSGEYYTGNDGFAIQLPGVIAVDKIGTKINTGNNGATTALLEYSTDSSNGVDGSWSPLTTINVYTALSYTEYPVSPAVQCRWLRCTPAPGYHCYLYNFSVFGELQNPSYEFWDENGVAELNTANYPLTFQPASNSADSHQELRFKIKNTSLSVHSYTVTVTKYSYAADAVVTSGITLSTDLGGSPAKTSSVTVSNIAAGAFSGVIRVFADVTIAANPADGYHYFSIDVVQS